jgi:hypothetical protein
VVATLREIDLLIDSLPPLKNARQQQVCIAMATARFANEDLLLLYLLFLEPAGIQWFLSRAGIAVRTALT